MKKKTVIKAAVAFGVTFTICTAVTTCNRNRLNALCKVPENPKFCTVSITETVQRQATSVPVSVSKEWEPDEADVNMIAKVLYRECCGCSKTQQAAVVWVILNRTYRADFQGSTIEEVITSPNQFCYNADDPVEDDLREITIDVLKRHHAENCGLSEDVGRVIPSDYFWFTGDGKINHFRNSYKGTDEWDWSLASPYEE